jgi:hypothetical protein
MRGRLWRTNWEVAYFKVAQDWLLDDDDDDDDYGDNDDCRICLKVQRKIS